MGTKNPPQVFTSHRDGPERSAQRPDPQRGGKRAPFPPAPPGAAQTRPAAPPAALLPAFRSRSVTRAARTALSAPPAAASPHSPATQPPGPYAYTTTTPPMHYHHPHLEPNRRRGRMGRAQGRQRRSLGRSGLTGRHRLGIPG